MNQDLGQVADPLLHECDTTVVAGAGLLEYLFRLHVPPSAEYDPYSRVRRASTRKSVRGPLHRGRRRDKTIVCRSKRSPNRRSRRRWSRANSTTWMAPEGP